MPGTVLSHFQPFGLNAVLFGVYDYLLPIMLYCAWSALAFIDLARTADRGTGRTIGWAVVVLLLPALGAALYLLAGGSTIGRSVRLGVVAGGFLIVAAAYGITAVRIG